jgi:hypothetical protein
MSSSSLPLHLLTSSKIIASSRQKPNPVFKQFNKFANNIEFVDITDMPDFILGGSGSSTSSSSSSSAAVALWYLSLKFHQIYPGFLKQRLSNLINNNKQGQGATRNNFPSTRVLLILVDLDLDEALTFRTEAVRDSIIGEITMTAIIDASVTLMLAFSIQEAAAIIETIHGFQVMNMMMMILFF